MVRRETKNLEEIVNDVLAQNTEALLGASAGKEESINKLVNAVMHRAVIKTDPRKIRHLILKKVA